MARRLQKAEQQLVVRLIYTIRIRHEERQRGSPDRGLTHHPRREGRGGEFDPRGAGRLHAHYLPHHRARHRQPPQRQDHANHHQANHLDPRQFFELD